MSTGSSAEAKEFAGAVAAVLDDHWGDATAPGDTAALWKVAAGQGWFELAGEGALDFLAAAVRELGRRSCPLPVADAYAVWPLLTGQEQEQVAAGTLRPVLRRAGADGVPARIECGDAVTHTVTVDLQQRTAVLERVTAAEPLAGLAEPPWYAVRVQSEGEPRRVGHRDLARALDVAALGLAARTLAAAERVHDLSVEHARTRHQFGRPIGAFGAVQQRVAACQIDVSATSALVADAVEHGLRESSPDRSLAIGLAVRRVTETAPAILFGAQHTLGAIGFFEEHEAAWLFRRVHADTARLRTEAAREDGDGVCAALLEPGRSLPEFDLGPAAEELRTEIRALLEQHRLPASTGPAEYDSQALRATMAERGLFALGWPREEGGRDAGLAEQAVLNEELKRAGGPVDRQMSASMLLGHSVLRHGTPEQKAEFLPLIRSGELAFCLGYSEPEAGSDLASLRTRAEREGGGWIINGQKSWTTRAQTASHVWLAVRTNPEATPRQAGITVFLVPMDTPGIQIQQHTALSGEISCTVFYDDVRVPDTARVGEVDGGWRVITDALAAERVVMGGVSATLLRQLNVLLEHVREAPGDLLGSGDSWKRDRLASLAARLQASRALVLEATRAMADGSGPGSTAAMAGVLGGELAEDFGQAVLELLGPQAALGADSGLAPGAGVFERGLRTAPMFVIGGGTNDIQRGLIARGLGLAREGRPGGQQKQ